MKSVKLSKVSLSNLNEVSLM